VALRDHDQISKRHSKIKDDAIKTISFPVSGKYCGLELQLMGVYGQENLW
jgi:hypothetical protein